MKVCVTGANGLIGSSLIRRLLTQPNLEITAFDRSPVRTDISVRWVTGDLQRIEDCLDLVKDQDVIFHLAHTNSPLTSDQDMVQDNLLNIIPTLTLLKAIERTEHAPHFIYPSSGGAVYGVAESRKGFKESDACYPNNSYGIQKLVAEHYIRLAAQRGVVTSTILRIANAYGWLLPPDRSQGFIGTAVTRILNGQPVRIFGNPDNVRDYIHIDDILESLVLAGTQRKKFEIYNVGTGFGISVMEIVESIEKILGHPVNRITVNVESAQLLNNWCVLDVQKIYSELGWQSKISVQEGIQRLLSDGSRSMGLKHVA